jgi:hypothetical protein
MEETDEYYRNKGGCDVKGFLITIALATILTLILTVLD